MWVAKDTVLQLVAAGLLSVDQEAPPSSSRAIRGEKSVTPLERVPASRTEPGWAPQSVDLFRPLPVPAGIAVSARVHALGRSTRRRPSARILEGAGRGRPGRRRSRVPQRSRRRVRRRLRLLSRTAARRSALRCRYSSLRTRPAMRATTSRREPPGCDDDDHVWVVNLVPEPDRRSYQTREREQCETGASETRIPVDRL